MTRPRLYLFIGFPGAGKTTVAKLIQDNTEAVHLWADRERQDMFDNVTHSKQESSALYDQLNERTAKLLGEGKSVIFDTNFNYHADRAKLRAIANETGADTLVIWLTTPVKLARDRALHEHHRDRNGYDHVMSGEQFDDLISRLEPPTEDEKFIKIDGSDIDIPAAKRQLEL